MLNVLIRAARLEDMPILKKFEQGVIHAERPFDQTLRPDPIYYYDLEQLITSKDSFVAVGTLDDIIISSGYAQIRSGKSYQNFEQFAYLGFMYVLPEYRGKGINGMILEALKSWCAKRDIIEMRLEVYSENTSAINAYTRAGFMRHMLEMRLPI